MNLAQELNSIATAFNIEKDRESLKKAKAELINEIRTRAKLGQLYYSWIFILNEDSEEEKYLYNCRVVDMLVAEMENLGFSCQKYDNWVLFSWENPTVKTDT